MKSSRTHTLFLLSASLSFLLACKALLPASAPTATIVPPLLPSATSVPEPSQDYTVISQSLNETNQTPPFTITAQIPQITGSDDPRIATLNQRLNELVTKEVDTWRKSFLENTFPTVANGSFLEATHELLFQEGDIWSFKFNFHFYSDGAAHPGSYSITFNYDLGQGREVALADLFLPNTNYLEAIADYCKAELSKQPFFDGAFTTGADPTVENYRKWNITPSGLMITFDEYQVAPYAAGPQMVQIPVEQLRPIVDPNGPLKLVLP